MLFDPARYGRLRPLVSGDRRRLDFTLERCPAPGGSTLLEIGSGPGKLLADLTRRVQPRLAVALDLDLGMARRARAAGLPAVAARAEAPPFASASVDLAFASLSFHLLADRAQAARELHRVLRPGGHAAIWTLTPEHIRGYHLNPYFPSLEAVDLARFEAPEAWLADLARAGFENVAEQELVTWRRTTAGRLARAARARFISTLRLLPEAELEMGVRRLEAEAARDPRRQVRHRQVWCLLWATR